MAHLTYKVFISFFLVVVLGKTTFAWNDELYPQNYALIYSLNDDWQVYDEKYKNYVPYIASRHYHPKSMSCWVNLSKFQGYTILFYSQPDTYLFINKSLTRKYTKSEWISLSIDSLRKIYQKEKIFFSFYDKSLRLPLKSIIIATKIGGVTNQPKTTNSTTKKSLERPIRKITHQNFTILGFFFILVIYTALWNYNRKIMLSFFSLRSSLSTLSRKEETLISKPLGGVNLMFLGAHSLVLSFLYALYALNSSEKLTFLYFDSNTLWGLLLSFMGILVLLSVGILCKYFMIVSFGLLLNIDKNAVKTHFFEYIRTSMIFYTTVVVLSIFFTVSYNYKMHEFYELFIYSMLIFHAFQFILISFFVFQQTQYKNLYLFYYLCITELTPLLIGIKLLLF